METNLAFMKLKETIKGKISGNNEYMSKIALQFKMKQQPANHVKHVKRKKYYLNS